MNLQEILSNNITFDLSNELLLLNVNTLNYVDSKLNYQISAGDSHSMILTDSGKLYVTGWNGGGQLGLSDDEDRNTFTLVDVPVKARESIVAISASYNHSMILTNSGEIYVTGINNGGRLGLGNNENKNTFTHVDVPAKARGSIVAISAGGNNSMILTNTGELYVTGWNYYGQLGLGDNIDRNTFTLVDVPAKARRSIVTISAGDDHSMFLTDSGELYVTGRNDGGQLGLADNTKRSTFTLVDVPVKARESIVAISAGDNHSMILTNSGELYVTGNNYYGQLGLSNDEDRDTFTHVDVPTKARESIVAISAGSNHSMILTDCGEIYVTGMNDYGQLGLDDNTDRSTFTLVDVPTKARESIVAISAGNAHSMILTDSGEIYVTGVNDFGQLGLGDDEDRNTFTLVDVPAKTQ